MQRKYIKGVITMNETIQKVESILQHIKKVESNCAKLGKLLIEKGNNDFGIRLIAAGRMHDLSKFSEFEFKYLWPGEKYFEDALIVHQQANNHHPECWRNIHEMPTLFIAEMVCDCVARAQEFGTDVRSWFENEATVKYGFTMEDPVGKAVTEYLNLLLTPKFS